MSESFDKALLRSRCVGIEVPLFLAARLRIASVLLALTRSRVARSHPVPHIVALNFLDRLRRIAFRIALRNVNLARNRLDRYDPTLRFFAELDFVAEELGGETYFLLGIENECRWLLYNRNN